MRLALVTIALFHLVCGALACSCIGERTVADEYNAAAAVFVGRVAGQLEVKLSSNPKGFRDVHMMRYTLVVEKNYRGVTVSDSVVVFTGMGGGDCGFRFEVGKRFIVYGVTGDAIASDYASRYPLSGPNIFRTNICFRTRAYDDEEDRALDELK
ncbi:MAG: hypothetical protein R2811_06010 [Flavobacteriales bacterium]